MKSIGGVEGSIGPAASPPRTGDHREPERNGPRGLSVVIAHFLLVRFGNPPGAQELLLNPTPEPVAASAVESLCGPRWDGGIRGYAHSGRDAGRAAGS